MIVDGADLSDIETEKERALRWFVAWLGYGGIKCETCACWTRTDEISGECAFNELGVKPTDMCSWWTEIAEDDANGDRGQQRD